MKKLLVVQHTHSEFLGAIEKQLENRGSGFSYARAEWPQTQRTMGRLMAARDTAVARPDIERPRTGTAVMAIKRLTRTYPLLDRRKLMADFGVNVS